MTDKIEGDILKLIAAIVMTTGDVTIDVDLIQSVDAAALKIVQTETNKITISVE